MVCPELVNNVLRILHDHTAGDPMRLGVKWTNLSRRSISRQLDKTETPAGKNVVARVLHEQGFRRRKPQKKKTMGENKDRNEQFKKINRLKKTYLEAGKPVLSIDSKKKETLGNFYREGVTDAVEPTIVNDHDFASQGNGKVIPHGIYDIGKNKAVIHLNTSKDTSEFSCKCLELWWQEHGQHDYPGEDEVLVICDGGGSNSSSSYLFKEDLQALSDRTGLKIRIAHYPPYCSKFNPIEHLVFPHVTRACSGVPLECIETAKHYIEKTETTTGLKVVVKIVDQVFEKGRKYAEDFKDRMRIKFDNILPKFNYTAVPALD